MRKLDKTNRMDQEIDRAISDIDDLAGKINSQLDEMFRLKGIKHL